MSNINYYKDFETGNTVQYRMNSMYDTPTKREERSELNFRQNKCQISSCKFYDKCDKIHRKDKTNKVKCLEYKNILHD